MAANAIPGYDGFAPGVYSENVLGLSAPISTQRAAYMLNSLERKKEKDMYRYEPVAMNASPSLPDTLEFDTDVPPDDASLPGSASGSIGTGARKASASDGGDYAEGQDVERQRRSGRTTKAVYDAAGNYRNKKGADWSNTAREQRNRKIGQKSYSQPPRRRSQDDRYWESDMERSVFAMQPDRDLLWDGPVSPPSLTACITIPGTWREVIHEGSCRQVPNVKVLAVSSEKSAQSCS